ncbi:TolC family protein [Methylomonas sp. AM2-LC]|uniref:TolC family protein n=1 Tax=Methylomonas sp. AM2-LC TaxID=3153301 RepID=UPI00326531AD
MSIIPLKIHTGLLHDENAPLLRDNLMLSVRFYSLLFSALLTFPALAAEGLAPLHNLNLAACIELALKNHASLAVSDAMVEMAEAQYQQAMSAYWPHVTANSQAQHLNHDVNFTMQGTTQLPTSNALNAQLSQLGQTGIALGKALAQPIPINMNVKLFDRDLLMSSVNLTYPIFTGGKITALKNQAEKGKSVAQENRRKTELEVIRDVKKYYYGVVFAQQMEQLANDTLERFKLLEELTERLFKSGSMKVKKTDYLRTKVTTSLTRSILLEAQYARDLALQALSNAMGLNWDNSLSINPENQAHYLPTELARLVETAQQFNPDLQQLKFAIEASESKITEAYSGYYPAIGFQGSAYTVQNSYQSGLTNANNRDGWTVGIGLQWNLFDGFETTNKVSYANAMKKQLLNQQILLDQGMALQIKQQFLRLNSADQQIKSNEEATGFATENRILNTHAYQEELVETKDVIESQIVETFAQSAVYRSRYELNLAISGLEYLVGSNIPELK